jgi:hypothetical protein
MTTPSMEQFSELLAERAGPCLSLYLPTAGRSSDWQQPIKAFLSLLHHVDRALGRELADHARTELMAPLHALAANERFWTHTLTGLAVLRAPDFYKVYKLQRQVPERAIVADSFHLKPLLRITQSADRFEVLALTREHVRYFHGNRDALDEVELHPGVPRTLAEALGRPVTQPQDDVAGMDTMGQEPTGVSLRRGSGTRTDEQEKDTARFFRAVDRAICEHHSKPSGVPLILAALAEHHTTFRSLSHNAQLLGDGITGNPEAFSADELRQKAWALFEPRYHERLTMLVEEFGAGQARHLASDAIDDVALAALGGRVRTLLVDTDRVIPGRIDRDTGIVTPGSLADAHSDDILDDLAELTLRMGGDVVMVPSPRMPTKTGIAAIYRF